MKKDMWIKELRLWKWKLVLEKWRSYLVSCTARPVSSRKEGRVASPGHRRRAHRGQTPSGLFRPLGKGTGHCHCAKCAVTTAGWEEGFGCGLAPSGCWKMKCLFLSCRMTEQKWPNYNSESYPAFADVPMSCWRAPVLPRSQTWRAGLSAAFG